MNNAVYQTCGTRRFWELDCSLCSWLPNYPYHHDNSGDFHWQLGITIFTHLLIKETPLLCGRYVFSKKYGLRGCPNPPLRTLLHNVNWTWLFLVKQIAKYVKLIPPFCRHFFRQKRSYRRNSHSGIWPSPESELNMFCVFVMNIYIQKYTIRRSSESKLHDRSPINKYKSVLWAVSPHCLRGRAHIT